MTSFQDAPDENIEHDEKMELRSSFTFFAFLLFCFVIEVGLKRMLQILQYYANTNRLDQTSCYKLID